MTTPTPAQIAKAEVHRRDLAKAWGGKDKLWKEPTSMTEPLSLERVEELERLLADATPQPWAVEGDFMVTRDPVEIEFERCAIADLRYFHLPHDKANSALIAAAVNALPALLSVARTALERPPAVGVGPLHEMANEPWVKAFYAIEPFLMASVKLADVRSALQAALTSPPPNPSREG